MKQILLGLLTILAVIVYSQGDLYTKTRMYNHNSRSFGVVLVSNGFGATYRIGRRIDGTKKRLYEIDALWIKHSKEFKIKSYDSGNRFIYGKLNFPFNFRFNYGKQKTLYEKRDLNAVSIAYYTTVGFTAVLLKPVYYYIINNDTLIEQKFNITEIHTYSQIYSRSSFFKGLDEITIVPGISLKTGFNFDFSASDERINAIDIGAALDIYLSDIEIMATEKNSSVLFSLFVIYRFGKITETRFN